MFTDTSSGTAIIRARKFNGLTPVDNDFSVSLDLFDEPMTNDDIALSGGRFVVVWERELSPTSHDIMFTIVNLDNTHPSLGSITTVGDQHNPHVATLINGDFVITFTSGNSVLYRR